MFVVCDKLIRHVQKFVARAKFIKNTLHTKPKKKKIAINKQSQLHEQIRRYSYYIAIRNSKQYACVPPLVLLKTVLKILFINGVI